MWATRFHRLLSQPNDGARTGRLEKAPGECRTSKADPSAKARARGARHEHGLPSLAVRGTRRRMFPSAHFRLAEEDDEMRRLA
jgi:hypothetical protein